MRTWLGRIRRAVLMAMIWAIVWAPLGVLMGMMVDADGSMDEPWVAVGAYPGFLCGLAFSAVLEIVESRRRFEAFSLSRAGAWGAASGLLAIVLPLTAVLGTPNIEHPFHRWRVLVVVIVTLLSSISAVASVLVARMAKKRESGGGGAGAGPVRDERGSPSGAPSG